MGHRFAIHDACFDFAKIFNQANVVVHYKCPMQPPQMALIDVMLMTIR